MNCTVCQRPDANNVIWAYAHRKGAEVTYPVCLSCATHPKHSEWIVDNLNRKLDRMAGYR